MAPYAPLVRALMGQAPGMMPAGMTGWPPPDQFNMRMAGRPMSEAGPPLDFGGGLSMPQPVPPGLPQGRDIGFTDVPPMIMPQPAPAAAPPMQAAPMQPQAQGDPPFAAMRQRGARAFNWGDTYFVADDAQPGGYREMRPEQAERVRQAMDMVRSRIGSGTGGLY